MAQILIIDDDIDFCDMLMEMVIRIGHEAECAYSIKEARAVSEKIKFDVVYLDVRLPDGNGIELIPELRNMTYCPEVIIITAAGSSDGASLAIKNGAWDYIEKPSSIEKMTLPLVRALEFRSQRMQNKPLKALKRQNIVGNSHKIHECLDLVAQVADTDVPVLITGETGTGKDLFAMAIHENSSRSDRSFVIVDCAALPETLVESVLFGHKKGAFTGADHDMDGLLKQADGGTLFLDEIGEMSLNIQKSFLRVLQEHKFRPVGGKSEVTSRFRAIAATNRDIKNMVKEGSFRNDLLFRLEGVHINIPPLRLRKEDIRDLTIHYINTVCTRLKIETKGLSEDFIGVLESYQWQGNVRELVHAIEHAVYAAQESPTLFPQHLPPQIRIQIACSSIDNKNYIDKEEKNIFDNEETITTIQDMRDNLITKAEKDYLEKLIEHTKADIKEACSISGLSRPRLYALLKKYDVKTK